MSVLQERIKERRSSLGMTLLEVADQLGIKEATMQRYESGEIKNIKHETIVNLAKIFHCSPSYLMGWEDSIVPTTAAHKEDNEHWTEEELHKIEEYKKLLLAARANKQ
ncbi:helix-turn-helix domain-containing protein [Anaerocolumna xylanovorans]|uniref:DNA-binding transcriptional regulator, XRE family n=1 Tax=Anaerocolumna xylanovorans DSM 12503 TaxID=1121345 RepID=A0A1M7Y657_9FIRM|nr:helix-turn-helix transcriptional regulator [Anaerocolumna xylanovorans]SHO48122.1 DNA-binding transcriptional regulator, XRE family [Anaerocolumna xylanovorans DSM 12503]